MCLEHLMKGDDLTFIPYSHFILVVTVTLECL
jgi:hypothetical protein